ncbi:hypothetical protein OQA88_8584 [Cercophora sp. LCS_1]
MRVTTILTSIFYSTAVLAGPLHPRATPCDEILDIIDDWGMLEGTLQGATILLPISGTSGTTAREILKLLDPATLNVQALYDSVPCSTATKRDTIILQRQNEAVCAALKKVSADVAQMVTLMARLAGARDKPARLDIEALQTSVDDAKAKIVIVQKALQASHGCVN